jgi:tetratricopeptide (TPR) repeat protein
MLIFISAGEYDNEKDLIKAATKFFKSEEYFEASPLYSQLVTNYPQNPEYNFKYGACLIYTSNDKSKAVKYLEYAVKNGVEDNLAMFYLARAYHLNYQFDEALKYYQKFKATLKDKEYEEYSIQSYINQATSGRRLIKDIQQIKVVDKKVMSAEEFFRTYRISGIDRKVLVLPEEFQTKEDKKRGFKSLIVHNPMNREIYFASYGDKGDNGLDIFKVMKFPDGTFSEPVNLGPYINTVSDENFPYLHPSGRVLYFASKGHNSIGGYDIFKSELDSFTNLWGKAQNIGFALNSPDDDILYISDKEEKVAYFASARNNNARETTVFTIINSDEEEDNVIFKGVIVAKGALNNEATIEVVKVSDGEIIGTFKSDSRTGDFLVTLEEEQEFTLNIQTEGSFLSTTIQTPDNREASVIKKEIVIENNALAVVDKPLLDGDKEVLDVLKAAAELDVNASREVAFNDPKVQRKVYKDGGKKSEVDNSTQPIEQDVPGEDDLIAKAEQELQEIASQKEKVKKEIDAAYYVANKKNVKAEILKKELNQLSEDQSIAVNAEEIESIKKKIVDKQAELKKMSMEAMASLTLAKNKENSLAKKEKEEELAKAYKAALTSAEQSGNSEKAIKALEDYNRKMDEIKDEIQDIEESSDQIFAKEIAKKKSAKSMYQAELEESKTEEQALIDEQNQLKSQANSTKNQALKDELLLQADEINGEIQEVKRERLATQTKINQVSAELEALENGGSVISEIETEANDDSFQAVLTPAQKESLSSNIESDRNMLTEEELSPEIINKEARTVDELKARNELADELVKTTAQEDYNDSKKKVELENATIESLNEEKELLEISIQNTESYAEKQKIQKQIDAIDEQKKASAEKLKKYVNQTQEYAEKVEEENLSAISREEKESLIAMEEKSEKIISEEPKTETIPQNEEKSLLTEEEKKIAKNEAVQKVNQIKWDGIDEESKSVFGASMEEVSQLRTQAKKTNDKEQKKELEEKANEIESEAYEKVIAAKEETLIELLRQAESSIEAMDPVAAKKLQSKLSGISDDYEKLSKDRSGEKKLENIDKILAALEELKKEIPASEEEVIVLNKQKPDGNDEIATDTEDAQPKVQNQENKEIAKVETTREETKTLNPQQNTSESSTNQVNEAQPKRSEVKAASTPSKEEVERNNLNEQLEMPRNNEVSYGIAPEVVKAQQAADAKEKEVIALLNEAESFRALAKEEPSKANKYEKKARKLEEDAVEKRAEIQESYGALNDNELETNFNEITYNIDNLFIDSAKVDTVQQIVRSAKTLQKEAKKLREKAKETKDETLKNELYNEAYEKEVAAIKKQNIILSGQFDVKEEESDVSFVVITGPKEENEYTKKAEEYRAKARNEEDEGKRLEYLDLARKYELASDENRNKRIEDEAQERKGAFDQRKPFIALAREQSKQNSFANEAYSLEMEADSIFNEGATLLRKAQKVEDRVERIEMTQRATDIIIIAKERQNDAIQKYQESKANPEDETVALAFSKEKDKKKTGIEPIKPAQNNTELAVNSTVEPDEETNEVPTDSASEQNQETNEPTEELAVNETISETINNPENNQPKEQTTQQESELPEPINNNQVVNELPIATDNASAEVAVQEKRARAKEIENSEASRVDKIYELKKKAKEAQEKSENALKKVDQLQDPVQIQQQLAIAEKFRQEAEQYEVQAKTEEEFLNNNMAEARALKQEAEMIEASQNQSDNSQPETITQSEPVEENVAVSNSDEETNVEAPVDEVSNEPAVEPTNELGREDRLTRPDISWDDVRLLGEKSADAETVNDNLSLGGNVTYSSSDEIPMDPEMPNGVIYKVQIGAFRNKINPSIFNGISPIVGESTGQGFTRYTAGTFRGFKSANMAKGRIRNLGFRDAFVVAFYNGKRITLDEAEEAIEKANDSEKFVYENIVQDEVDQLKAVGITEEEAFATGNADVSRSPVVNSNPSATASVPAGNLNQRTDVYFTVQVGAFSSPKTSAQLYGIQPLYSFTTPNGIIRYSTGVYKSFSEADQRKQQVRSSTGPADAFVTAYNGQNKISVDEAKQQLGSSESVSSESTSNTVEDNQATGEISFAVQIGAYRTEIDPNNTPILQNLTQYGIKFQQSGNGFYIYFAGNFNNKLDADNLKNIIREAGISDAFVVAFQDGSKISVRKALELLGQ